MSISCAPISITLLHQLNPISNAPTIKTTLNLSHVMKTNPVMRNVAATPAVIMRPLLSKETNIPPTKHVVTVVTVKYANTPYVLQATWSHTCRVSNSCFDQRAPNYWDSPL